MKVFRALLSYVPVIAIVFVIIYVSSLRVNLEVRQFDVLLVLLSLLLLILALLLSTVLWHRILWRFGVEVGFGVAFASQAKAILMKYIPGKVWVLLGRADGVSRHGHSLPYCMFISVLGQVLTTASGFLVGAFGILLFDFSVFPSALVYVLLALLMLAVALSTRAFTIPESDSRFVPKTLRPLLGRRIPPMADILLLSMMYWLVVGGTYLVFIRAIGVNVGLQPVLLQPLANSIGVAFYLAPGGLGVREGIMIGYLTLADVSVAEATAISIMARLWFLVGEGLTFLLGWVVHSRERTKR